MKKLTLHKGKIMACLILMCLSLIQGCRKDLLQPNSNLLQNSLSIAEARKYYDANLKKSIRPRKLMSTGGAIGNAVGEPTIEDILYK